MDVLYEARDTGFEGHVVAVAPRGGARAVRAALREGIDAVVWEDQIEVALPLAAAAPGSASRSSRATPASASSRRR